MLRFVVLRILQAAASLLVVAMVTFLLSHAAGDPRNLLLPPTATAADFEAFGRVYGLDQPLPVQFGRYLWRLLQGDLGTSLRSHEAVTIALTGRIGPSAELGLAAVLFSIAIGIPLGVLSATQRATTIDFIAKTVVLIGQSVPSFWIGILLVQVFAVQLRWLPSGGNDGPLSLLMPAVTIGLAGGAAVTRLLRNSMLEILPMDFVMFARIKGVSESGVIWRHALRNAVLPVISFVSIFFVNLVTVSVVVETVFAWPGLGLLAKTSIVTSDYPVIQGVVLLGGGLSIATSTIVDVVYSWIDPRVRFAAR